MRGLLYRRKQIKRMAHARRPFALDWVKDGVPYRVSDNELAIKHPMDCGRSRCGLCSSQKHNAGRDRRQRENSALRVEESAW